ncbi:MAG: hypothetical protein V1837_06615 [Candidatus Woesearchaeota archaeon]
MKNNYGIVALIFIIMIFIAGCASNQKASVDCGTDTACFSNNFKTCTPSKFMGGLTEIKGGTPASCQVFMQSQDNPSLTGGERLTMLCDVKNTDAFKESEMNGYGIYQKGASCTGKLYDFYKNLVKP